MTLLRGGSTQLKNHTPTPLKEDIIIYGVIIVKKSPLELGITSDIIAIRDC